MRNPDSACVTLVTDLPRSADFDADLKPRDGDLIPGRRKRSTGFRVLDAERTLLQTEISEEESAVATSTDLVALYKALGGGWEGAKSADTRDAYPGTVAEPPPLKG